MYYKHMGFPRQAELVLDAAARLGESPRWLSDREHLLWLDIYGHELHLTDPRAGSDTTQPLTETVGALAPRNEAEAVVAAPSGLFAVGYDSGLLTKLLDFRLPDDVRFNDGICDALGRFWAGTLAEDDYRPSDGRVVRIEPDLTVTTQIQDIGLSNGIGLSPRGERLYFIDSLLQRLDVFDFDLDTGSAECRRTLVQIDPADGIPDGLTVDREGGIWVAIFGSGRVRRYTEAGALDMEIVVPAANVTACTFGDTDLGTLYITSAAWSPSGRDAGEPGAGGVFAVRPGVTGLPCQRFGG
jgi:sugar lactone lactonase YvrE